MPMYTLNTILNTVIVGNSWEVAPGLPAAFARCIVTSPPYFGHREYAQSPDLQDLELGRETDLALYVTRLTTLFAELRRTLTTDGSLWLNLGDTYRNGELLGVPWRVALALQADGWLLRSEIIWHKPNAMPSSVKNRPTTDHEHLFLFAKSKDYHYDADAIREPHVTFSAESKMKGGRKHLGKRGSTPEQGKNGGNSNLHDARWDQYFHPLGRNKRTVWSIPLGKYRGTHFAVFPEKLVETCILAGTQEGDAVLDPFMGAGTTGLVARRLGCDFVGIELIAEYAALATQRTQAVQKQSRLLMG